MNKAGRRLEAQHNRTEKHFMCVFITVIYFLLLNEISEF